MTDPSRLASKIRSGDRRALAKGISLVENDPGAASSLLKALRPNWKTFVVGVTGPPGTGKSTLVDRLIGHYRDQGLKVGVIAVDPTSPITGGALLGDRVRMADHAGEKDVFIRSMATRGWSGGLSRSASQAIQLMDAAGFDIIFLETVGIGQADIEVVGVAHAVLVVLMPGMGDDIQMSKAGLMEVGDIYVVNKSDLEGANAMTVSILGMLRSSKARARPVVTVSARSGEGIDGLTKSIDGLLSLHSSGDPAIKLKVIKGMIIETARGDLIQRFSGDFDFRASLLSKRVLAGKLTVDEAASKLLK